MEASYMAIPGIDERLLIQEKRKEKRILYNSDIKSEKKRLTNSNDQKQKKIAEIIIALTSEYFEMEVEQLMNSGLWEDAYRRQVAMYFCWLNCDLILRKIGKEFNKTHATISHAVMIILRESSVNAKTKRHIADLDKTINEKLTIHGLDTYTKRKIIPSTNNYLTR